MEISSGKKRIIYGIGDKNERGAGLLLYHGYEKNVF